MEFASSTQSKPTGLKLVLPSLKSVLAAKNVKKNNGGAGSFSYPTPVEDVLDIVEKKPSRPAKLKPLREVLFKLVAQLKRKDDYAFFLTPVDAENVPGYSDVVKSPMDLGTMTEKVNRGKYRSLDEFAADFRLVTTNAKIFNPPGSIYYVEADRMEAYGMDHINRAAGTVIQHEADWNIDIERDDDTPTVNIEDEDEERMEMDDQGRARSVSVQSQPQQGSTRRGPRGPYRRQPQASSTQVSELVDSEGRLPGSKDGIGAFPAASDWAKTMLQLKLKAKKYRTKKERMKIERDGPPVLPEGSLDYTEMEDPFSVLSNLVPDPPSRPALTPLYSPLFINENLFYPAAITAPPNHALLTLPKSKQRCHWTIARNVNSRQKAKDKEEDPEASEPLPWQVPREVYATDFGSFSILAGELAEEMRRRGMTPCTVQEGQEQECNLDWIREGLEPQQNPSPEIAPRNTYWTKEKAMEGETYLRDLVYGGVDGLAYVRSLAEFMRYDKPGGDEPALGMLLARWVEKNVVDVLTGGRHSLIRDAAGVIETPSNPPGSAAKQAATSLHIYPVANAALTMLRSIRTHKIDMAALIKTPEELFLSEEEWHGKELKERRKQSDGGVKTEKVEDAMEVEEPEPSWMMGSSDELEGPEELKEVLEYVAAVILDLNRRNLSKRDAGSKQQRQPAKAESVEAQSDDKSEDPVLRNLRLNLLALAKRAPLDTIARLPKDLVPEHIRQFVPTLGSST